jgi:hypothetical protein
MHPSLPGVDGVRRAITRWSGPSHTSWTRSSAVVAGTGQPPTTGIRRCSNYAVAYRSAWRVTDTVSPG